MAGCFGQLPRAELTALLWNVKHTTRYTYSAPVFLEPQSLRLTPSTDPDQKLVAFELTIDPTPIGRSENLDVAGNHVTRVWFEGQTQFLSIEMSATVETLRGNPFDYLWDGPKTMPVRYPEDLRDSLWVYGGERVLGEVGALADAAAVEVGGDAQMFPIALVAAIHRTCRQVYREEGKPRPAAETLQRKEGSCRDLTQLFLETSRGKGFAARFVSGYVAHDEEASRELHAWAEVYMPGGGWRGFDPSLGLAVGEYHIAVARGADASHASPLSGTIRGNASATLSATVNIDGAEAVGMSQSM
jgi:transglutaminase-like putative cysteine protease